MIATFRVWKLADMRPLKTISSNGSWNTSTDQIESQQIFKNGFSNKYDCLHQYEQTINKFWIVYHVNAHEML